MKTGNMKNLWNGTLAVLSGLALCGSAPVWAQSTNADSTAVVPSTNAATTETAVADASGTNTAPTDHPRGIVNLGRHPRHGTGDPLVVFGQNVEVKAGETQEAVIVIGGSAKVDGSVKDAVVVIGGKAEINGEVGDAVVAVCGSVQLNPTAKVAHDAVAVCGSLQIQDGASVGGDAVSVLGNLDAAKTDAIKGQIVNVLAGSFPSFEPLQKWFKECVLKLRPLAPSVGWVWAVAGVYLLLYLLVSLALPRPVQHCVDEITRRPATTFLIGLMTKMLTPIVTLILVATGIGIFIVPFLAAALLFAGIVGKTALLQYFGQQLGKQFTGGSALRPLVALLLGAALLAIVYIVPVLGLLAFLTTAIWAMGAAVMALFGSTRREMPERPQPPVTPPTAAYAPVAAVNMGGVPPVAGLAPMPVGAPAMASDGSAQQPGTATAAFAAPPAATAAAPAIAAETWTLPRAGFWERMGAAFLDVILVGIVSGIAGAMTGGPLWFFLIALAYFAGLWTWKGTTIGCIVLKLKVVRLDGQPMTFPVALVRGLAAAFSVVVMFLGFLWIAWDKEKQGWHDKIAGTVVVRLPQTQALVCL